MNSSDSMTIQVDALIARIRAEVSKRRHVAVADEPPSGAVQPGLGVAVDVGLNPLPLPNFPKPMFAPAERYQLNDFLALHDEDFINAAYRGVLKRTPDSLGQARFLDELRSGTSSKVQILGHMRYSPEGRRNKVPIGGLFLAYVFQQSYRLRLIGPLIAFSIALLRLPRLARTLQGIEGYQHRRNIELEAAIVAPVRAASVNERKLAGAIQSSVEHSTSALAKLSEAIDAGNKRLDSAEQASAAQLALIDAASKRLEAAAGESATRLTALINSLAARSDELANQLNELSQWKAQSHSMQTGLSVRLDALELLAAANQTAYQVLENHLATIETSADTTQQRVTGLSQALHSDQRDAQNLRMRMIERLARIESVIVGQRERTDGPAMITPVSSPKRVTDSSSSNSRFDRLYFAFEQRFRGSREDIRRRLSYYLPLLRDSVVGSAGAPLLDIGCGRGEWLQLLRDENIMARGVDSNATMIQQCAEHGLNVYAGDAIEYLKQLPDNALGALTGFHIIEHIPLETLLDLIEQAHRVVQPGGIVIFETPNPENIVVGACNFYIDPTHQRPLPPILTQFLVESGGFVDVAIHRVNADFLEQVFVEAEGTDPPALRAALNYLRRVFLCAPDYSVVGRVP